jgi:hypothetical protein
MAAAKAFIAEYRSGFTKEDNTILDHITRIRTANTNTNKSRAAPTPSETSMSLGSTAKQHKTIKKKPNAAASRTMKLMYSAANMKVKCRKKAPSAPPPDPNTINNKKNKPTTKAPPNSRRYVLTPPVDCYESTRIDLPIPVAPAAANRPAKNNPLSPTSIRDIPSLPLAPPEIYSTVEPTPMPPPQILRRNNEFLGIEGVRATPNPEIAKPIEQLTVPLLEFSLQTLPETFSRPPQMKQPTTKLAHSINCSKNSYFFHFGRPPEL